MIFNLKINSENSHLPFEVRLSRIVQPTILKLFHTMYKPFIDHLKINLPESHSYLSFHDNANGYFLKTTLAIMSHYTIFFKFTDPKNNISNEITQLFALGHNHFKHLFSENKPTEYIFNLYIKSAMDKLLNEINEFRNQNKASKTEDYKNFRSSVDFKQLEFNFLFNNLIYDSQGHVLAGMNQLVVRNVYLKAMHEAFKHAIEVDKVFSDEEMKQIHDALLSENDAMNRETFKKLFPGNQ